MRAIWKGSISFGLINIPIGLFPATRREELTFRLLRASDLSPINYKRVAEADGKEVSWEQIVKGYEYEKDKFVVLKEEDFKRVDIEATQTVDIIDFVKLAEINPMFFQKPYYMEPAKAGTKAYVLLREALQSTGKVGIAKVVIRARQHLAAVRPSGDALMLELMHFADELVGPEELNLPARSEVRKREAEMAEALIHQMSDKWEPARYKDDYKSALLKLIEQKVEGGPTRARSAKPPRPTNVIDLADVLRKSLGEAAKKSRAPSKRSSKRSKPEKRRKAA
jgi:DNA end-binding protein Ku